mgnify:CR=1 FL=1
MIIETPDELADYIADLLGIYEDPRCGVDYNVSCGCENPNEAGYGGDPVDGPEEVGEHCHLIDQPGEMHHEPDCDCRVWWAPRMADRIRAAVRNERLLASVTGQEAQS